MGCCGPGRHGVHSPCMSGRTGLVRPASPWCVPTAKPSHCRSIPRRLMWFASIIIGIIIIISLSAAATARHSFSVIRPCTVLPKFQRTEIFCRNTSFYLLCRFLIDPISTSSVLSILQHLKSRARFISAVYYNNCDKKLCNIWENEKKYCYVKNVKIK